MTSSRDNTISIMKLSQWPLTQMSAKIYPPIPHTPNRRVQKCKHRTAASRLFLTERNGRFKCVTFWKMPFRKYYSIYISLIRVVFFTTFPLTRIREKRISLFQFSDVSWCIKKSRTYDIRNVSFQWIIYLISSARRPVRHLF